jgi:hypothetical protein
LKTKADPSPELTKIVANEMNIESIPVNPNSAGPIIRERTIERIKVNAYCPM